MVTAPNILIIGGASVRPYAGGGKCHRRRAQRRGLVHRIGSPQSRRRRPVFWLSSSPLPDLFAQAAACVDWQGPACQLHDIPHFEIVYDDHGDARMESATWGLEDTLNPAMLPDALLPC